MPVRNVVLFSIASLIIPSIAVNMAHADITTTSLTISASCVPGPLSISVPGALVFSAVSAPSMATTVSSISTATMGTVLVTDARCDAPGTAWTASAIATALTPPAGPTIAASLIGYTSGVIGKTGTVAAVAVDQINLTGVVPVVTAVVTGSNTAWWTPTITVTVPSGQAVGTYTGSITQSVA